MRNIKIIGQTLMVILSIIAMMSLVFAESAWPSQPTTMTYQSNTTTAYPNGTAQSLTRGYIHTININEAQPSLKWIGVIGNITGQYALIDSLGYQLYDWDIATTTGEIYATRESNLGDWREISGGGIPYWQNLTCATPGEIFAEARFLNHTKKTAFDSYFEDSLHQTFNDSLNPFTLGEFYAGETRIYNDMITAGTANCNGIYMNQNGTNIDNDPSGLAPWQEVILTDGTEETETGYWTDEGYGTQKDIIYAAKIYNNTLGYVNDTTFDFQMILPQSAEAGSVENVPYYFYVELI